MASKFSKKHYEEIATVLQNAHPIKCAMPEHDGGIGQWAKTCKDLAEMFERDSHSFSILRFMRACQPGANVRARKCPANT